MVANQSQLTERPGYASALSIRHKQSKTSHVSNADVGGTGTGGGREKSCLRSKHLSLPPAGAAEGAKAINK